VFKGWKTIAFFAFSGLAYLLGWDKMTELISPQYLAIATSIVGLALRYVTTSPMGKKG